MRIRAGLIVATSLACFAGPLSSPAAAAEAADPQLRLPAVDSLQREASDSVDITLGSGPLGMATWALSQSDDPRDRDLLDTVRQLKSIRIRSFKFATIYDHSLVETVRSQLSEPGWNAVTRIHKRGDDARDLDIYVHTSHEVIDGFALIASDPHELTILNIAGSVDPAKLARLSNRLGLPELPM